MNVARLALACAALCLPKPLAMADNDGFPEPTIGGQAGMHAGNTALGLSTTDLQMMSDAGVGYVRVGMRWKADIEKTFGSYTWGPHDNLFAQLEAHNLKPLVVVTHSHPDYDTNGVTMDEQAERDGFAAFASAAAARYDKPGFLWEVWNEQNTANFWTNPARADTNSAADARLRAQNYLGLMSVLSPAMKTASPDLKLITGGVLDVGWGNTQAWHDEVLAGGILDLVDGLGVHTYGGGQSLTPELYLEQDIAGLRSLIQSHGGPADLPILNTEYGTNRDQMSGTDDQRLHDQASVYTRMRLLSNMVGLRLDTRYQWQQAGFGDDAYAVIDPSGGERPAYEALGVLTDTLGGFSFLERIDVGNPGDYVLVFQSGAQRKIAAWTTGEDHSVVIPIDHSLTSIATTGLLGEAGQLAPHAGAVSVDVTGDPLYLDLGAIGLAGDFNQDGLVNAADYVVWRSSPEHDQSDYQAWRDNYGATSYSPPTNPPGTRAQTAPAPSSAVLVACCLFARAGGAHRATSRGGCP